MTRLRVYLLPMAIAVLYAVLAYLTPAQIDDLMFLSAYTEHNGGAETFSPHAWLWFITEMRQVDNGRLSNITDLAVSLHVAKWLFSLISGMMVAAIYYMAVAWAGVSRSYRTTAVVGFWIAGIVLLPWRNNMMVPDYLLNYVWSTFWLLGFLLLADRLRRSDGRVAVTAGAMVCGFLTGWFHEGFGLPLVCAMLCVALRFRFRLPWRWWLAAGALCVGLGITLSAPHLWIRAGSELGTWSLIRTAKTLAVILPGVVILCLWCVILLTARNRKWWIDRFINSPGAIASLVIVAVSAGIALPLDSTPRSGWLPEFFSMIIFMMLLRQRGVVSAAARSTLKRYTPLATAMTALFMIWVISLQWQLDREVRDFEALSRESRNGTVFAEMIDPTMIRRRSLYMVSTSYFVEPFNLNNMQRLMVARDNGNSVDYGLERLTRKTYVKVPPEILTAPRRELQGDAGAVAYGSALVSDDLSAVEEGDISVTTSYNFVTRSGRRYDNVVATGVIFRDDANRLRLWIYPHHARFEEDVVRVEKNF